MRERVHDAGAERDQADSARNEHEVLAAIILHRESVAVGAAYRELVARLQRMQRRGATAHLPDRKERLILSGTGWKRGWKLAHSEKRDLRKLARQKATEGFLFRSILKVPIESLHFMNLIHDAIEHCDFGQINVLDHVWNGDCRWRVFDQRWIHASFPCAAERRIISTTLGMPMSP